jgi:hypothetical protein
MGSWDSIPDRGKEFSFSPKSSMAMDLTIHHIQWIIDAV